MPAPQQSFRCFSGNTYDNVHIPSHIVEQFNEEDLLLLHAKHNSGVTAEGNLATSAEYRDVAPRYLAPNGILYNKYYVPLPTRLNQHEMLPVDLFATTPLPDAFPDYETYESTLLEWLGDVWREIGANGSENAGIRLPNVTGRVLYRPQVLRRSSGSSGEETKQHSYDFSNSQQEERSLGQNTVTRSGSALDSMGVTTTSDLNASLAGEASVRRTTSGYLEAPTNGKINSRSNSNASSTSISSTAAVWWEPLFSQKMAPTWEAALVPPEPLPQDFEHFEHYENTMQRWAYLCRETMDVIAPSAQQLGEILRLDSNGKFRAATIHNGAIRAFLEEKAPSTGGTLVSREERSGHIPVVKNLWSSYSEKTRRLIEKSLEELLACRNQWKERYGEYVTPLRTSTIAGRFRSDDPIQKDIQLDQAQVEFVDAIPNVVDTLSWIQYNRKSLRWNFVFLPSEDSSLTMNLPRGALSYMRYGTPGSTGTPYTPYTPSSQTNTPQTPSSPTGRSHSLHHDSIAHQQFITKLKKAIQMVTTSDLNHQQVLPRQHRSIKDYYTCEDKEQDMVVDFTIPDFELGCIDFSLLHDSVYSQYVRQLLKKMDNCTRLFHLYSWNYPTLSVMIHEMHNEQLIQSLHAFLSSPDERHLRNLFTGDAYFDVFMKFLNSPVDEDMSSFLDQDGSSQGITINKILLSHLMVSDFTCILDLFENSNSELVHAKIAGFCRELLHTEMGMRMVETLVNKVPYQNTVKYLHYLVSALTFFSDVPLNIRGFELTCQHILREKYGDEFMAQVSRVYCIHYLVLAASFIGGENPLLQLPHSHTGEIYKLFVASIDRNMDNLSTFLSENAQSPGSCTPSDDTPLSGFLNAMCSLVVHQSKRLSDCAEFVLTHLLEFAFFSSKLRDIIAEYNPFMGLRQAIVNSPVQRGGSALFSAQRMRHVQNSSRRIFKYMCQSAVWNSDIQEFCLDVPSFVHDCIRRSVPHTLAQSPALISSMLCDYVCHQLTISEYEPAERIPFVEELIHREVFKHILDEIKLPQGDDSQAHILKNVIHQGTFVGSRILSHLTKYGLCIDAIAVYDPEKKKVKPAAEKQKTKSKLFKTKSLKKGFSLFIKKRKNASGARRTIVSHIEITSDVIQRLLDLISVNHSEYYHTFETRNNLLDTLRYILKPQNTFNQRPSNFTQTLCELCARGEDISFNRNCWRLWYQLVKYHPAELERLISSGQIVAFIELIGSDNMFVCTNALRYIGKALLLLESTQQLPRVLYKKQENSRSFLKTGSNVVPSHVQKQHRGALIALVDHLSQHVNLLCSTYSKFVPGTQPFQSLVRFYEIIYCHSETKKLLQIIRRNPEFHDTLEHAMDHIYAKAI